MITITINEKTYWVQERFNPFGKISDDDRKELLRGIKIK
jgi:hypothetical protein